MPIDPPILQDPTTTQDWPALQDWIGRTEEAAEVLTAAQVQRFLATFDRDGPLDDGADAPLLIHLCLTQPAIRASALGPDGHPTRGGFLPPVPLPRRMWAGGEFTFHAPPRIGDRLIRQSRIRDIQLKQGRSGPLCFVTVDHRIEAAGRLAVTERQEIVYRGADGPPVPVTSDTAPAGVHQRVIRPDATLLFRYSALTFNGHRIHYDAPYVTGVEGYPGLIVHGPLQATLLAQMAADVAGRPPSMFRFRSLSPLFDTADVMLNASPDGPDGANMALWTARPGGPVAMQAQASW